MKRRTLLAAGALFAASFTAWPAYGYWARAVGISTTVAISRIEPPGSLEIHRADDGYLHHVELTWSPSDVATPDDVHYRVERAKAEVSGAPDEASWASLDTPITCSSRRCRAVDPTAPDQAVYRVLSTVGDIWESSPSTPAHSWLIIAERVRTDRPTTRTGPPDPGGEPGTVGPDATSTSTSTSDPGVAYPAPSDPAPSATTSPAVSVPPSTPPSDELCPSGGDHWLIELPDAVRSASGSRATAQLFVRAGPRTHVDLQSADGWTSLGDVSVGGVLQLPLQDLTDPLVLRTCPVADPATATAGDEVALTVDG